MDKNKAISESLIFHIICVTSTVLHSLHAPSLSSIGGFGCGGTACNQIIFRVLVSGFFRNLRFILYSWILFQSLLNGLICYKPDDPVEFLESCLQKVKELGGSEKVKWDTFVSQEKRTLPPLNGGQSRRSFFRNGNV